MQLAESTTLNKVLDFEVRHLQSMEMPALKVGASAPPAPAKLAHTRNSGGVVSLSCCDGLVYLLGYTGSV